VQFTIGSVEAAAKHSAASTDVADPSDTTAWHPKAKNSIGDA